MVEMKSGQDDCHKTIPFKTPILIASKLVDPSEVNVSCIPLNQVITAHEV
jgi:hypothetical protein